jgi:anaerobic magnesium-protoporphyrin IX monomethyl ester cyclase
LKTVLLIHPPHPNSTDDRLDPPLGLLYIAAHLEKNGIPVEIKDFSGCNSFPIPFADIYGITSYVSTLAITEQIAGECRKVNPSCKVVIGGAHATARPGDFPYADHVIQGYGEGPMLALCGKEAPVDLFTFPAYHLVNLRSYSRKIHGKVSLPYLTSRGCPFKCAFCGLSSLHSMGGLHMEQPQVIRKHLERIKGEFGIDRINFQDDIFTLNKERLSAILDTVKALDLRFRCMGRAGYDTEDTYKRLADAGCEQIAWGIESGSQYILDRMNKATTARENHNVIKWAKQNGIIARAFFIIGFPGETKETLAETRRFIEDADPDQYFVSKFVPYPGTDVGDHPAKYGIINKSADYNKYYQVSKDGTGGDTIDTEWLTKEELRELELGFRDWLKSRPMRGVLQDYEQTKGAT